MSERGTFNLESLDALVKKGRESGRMKTLEEMYPKKGTRLKDHVNYLMDELPGPGGETLKGGKQMDNGNTTDSGPDSKRAVPQSDGHAA